mgnify:CR=1 FL=1|tara:strand:+ start:234 stop:539 length:306 start_codon:yes stop_codon:yes gene_type:complete
MKLTSPEVAKNIVSIRRKQDKSRLCLLMLEFYAYMEQQGFPEFWENCIGTIYPMRHAMNKDDHNLYWWFKWKDGTETKLLADDINMRFRELKGFTLDEENK